MCRGVWMCFWSWEVEDFYDWISRDTWKWMCEIPLWLLIVFNFYAWYRIWGFWNRFVVYKSYFEVTVVWWLVVVMNKTFVGIHQIWKKCVWWLLSCWCVCTQFVLVTWAVFSLESIDLVLQCWVLLSLHISSLFPFFCLIWLLVPILSFYLGT